jgi:ABC-type uncharacterized transport system substrate-binding protein
MISRLASIIVAAVAAVCAIPVAAVAHPHVWVVANSELIYGDDGAVTGVRHAWKFDDMFSAYALQGIETKTKGVYTREDLAPLAQTNVDSLKEFKFFTFAKTGEGSSVKKQRFSDPVDYYLEYKDSALVLHFMLPFKAPVKSKELALEIFDPSYFVDFALGEQDPIKLVGAPASCSVQVQRPTDGTAKAQTLDEDTFTNGENANFGAMFANKVTVTCP